jgi:protein N-terminal methyltransferase
MNVDASVDGVLGGFGHISATDVKGSKDFLFGLGRIDFTNGYAAECGGGIGRTSKDLLTPLFKGVDLIEPCGKFVAKAKELLKDNAKMENYWELGLEAWTPQPGRYSLIWCQWVLPHLPDDDLVAFFQRCVAGLAPGGVIGVKENIARDGFIMDKDDTSITRTALQYKSIFKRAGLKIIADTLQTGFPSVLFPVRMFALIPDPAATAGAVAGADAAAGTGAGEGEEAMAGDAKRGRLSSGDKAGESDEHVQISGVSSE